MSNIATLVARLQIASYSPNRSASSSEPWLLKRFQVCSLVRSQHGYLIMLAKRFLRVRIREASPFDGYQLRCRWAEILEVVYAWTNPVHTANLHYNHIRLTWNPL